MAENTFRERIANALNDAVLRGALGKFGEVFPEARANVYKGIDFEALRQQIKDIKCNTVSKVEELADRFEKEATKRGAVVYRAGTAEDVKKYIAELAKKHNAKSIVKSKSMVSEEIHLNEYLEKQGIQMIETDLGEWIVQHAGEKPSHMVMPAIHMPKERVAKTFTAALKREIAPDIPLMVKTARSELRDKFLTADMGISGANIAVAETGTLCMFTNEGNGRLTATLPPVHIFLVGYEKLVEKLSDVPVIAKALPKSATAQNLTSYVTMITGPVETLIDDKIVKKEFHIILIDNGRRKMMEDPKFKEAAQCIRCASCLNVCPVFQMVSGHVYGHIYTGGIGTILTAFFNSMQEAKNPQNLCIGCRRCVEFCPGKIDIPKLILELRKRIVDKESLPFTQHVVLENVLTNRKLFHTMLRQASWAQKPFSKGTQFIRHLPFFLSEMAEWRSLPAIAEVPFRDRFPKIKQQQATKGKVSFFSGCLIDFAYPEIGESLVESVNKLGYEVVFPEKQSCCGAPARYMGEIKVAQVLAKQNIEALENGEVQYILSACPTCTESIKHDWAELLKDDEGWLKRAKAVSDKVLDYAKFVAEVKGETSAKTSDKAQSKKKVTYHDSCHLKRSLGVWEEPRKLLAEKEGLELVEMKESDRCCGFGGSYSLKMPQIASQLLERKIQNIIDSGADIVAVDCPGCMLNIKGGLDKKGSRIQVKHTAEILNDK
ncbi:MAG: hypothetical protein JG781_998 [Peptococcaceae bacterium]|jgi:iron-sulfur cluster protein|nr:hypothetical protein [Peptococcaceae bacterium]